MCTALAADIGHMHKSCQSVLPRAVPMAMHDGSSITIDSSFGEAALFALAELFLGMCMTTHTCITIMYRRRKPE